MTIKNVNESDHQSFAAKIDERFTVSVETTAVPLLQNSDTEHGPTTWPTTPRAIRRPVFLTTWNSLFDLLLFSCATAFLSFAITVGCYDQAEIEEHPHASRLLLNGTKYGPTVFPILFALILGRATHTILLWRLERGERIGVLDTLASSTSLTATAVSQFQLRSISGFGIALLMIWALSPVGGQASLRQMTVSTAQNLPTIFEYVVHNGFATRYDSIRGYELIDFLDTLLNGAIIAPASIRSSPRDLWANVKIPRVEYYEKYEVTSDEDGWYSTRAADGKSFNPIDAKIYTSLIGIPINGMDLSWYINYTMPIETQYLNVACTLRPGVVLGEKGTPTPNEKLFSDCSSLSTYSSSNASFYYGKSRNKTTKIEDLIPYEILYTTSSGWDETFTLNCSVTASYVEVEVLCPDKRSCLAKRIRRSRLGHLPPSWTFLDNDPDNQDVLLRRFLSSFFTRGYYSASLLEKYLSDPDQAVVGNTTTNLTLTTQEDYSVRFGQLLNSYFNAANGLYAITEGINGKTSYTTESNETFVPKSDNGSHTLGSYRWSGEYKRAKAWTARGTRDSTSAILVANKLWMATLAIISAVLIVATLISPVIHLFLLQGPDVLMNVSSLATRNNAYIPLPEGGSYLQASERARLVKNIRVRLGDADDGAGTGHLVIGTMKDEDGYKIARVQKGRLYE